jgi:hypothetical protein
MILIELTLAIFQALAGEKDIINIRDSTARKIL